MNKGLDINIEIGLCTKDMAKEDPIKDFEILVEEYKEKWSEQMYGYFKECLNEIKKKEKALEIVKVLFQGRCKLYERTGYIETCNEEGCHTNKIAITAYILEFHNYDLHYEFHLLKDEYDLIKEVLL